MTNVICGLTAKKPGSAPCPTLVIEMGTAFTVRLHVVQRTALLSQLCPSVRLSVRLSDVFIVTNEITFCQYLNTIRNRDISSLSTATGVAGNCPLPPEIFAKSDPSGLKCSVDNCTVNFSDVGTAHCSRTVSLR